MTLSRSLHHDCVAILISSIDISASVQQCLQGGNVAFDRSHHQSLDIVVLSRRRLPPSRRLIIRMALWTFHPLVIVAPSKSKLQCEQEYEFPSTLHNIPPSI